MAACYPKGFKIRSKADVYKALNYMTEGEHRIIIDHIYTIFICIYADGKYEVLLKVGNPYDIFNPCLKVDPVNTLWKYRKYVNKKYFS